MQRAFTLIELLVVVSIIALLIAILLPALGAAKDSAKFTQCQINTRSLGQATMAYLADNKDQMARGAEGGDFEPIYGKKNRGVPFIRLADYLNLQPVYPNWHPTLRNEYYLSSDLFRCPSRDLDLAKLLDYNVNSVHFTFYNKAKAFRGGAEAGYIGGGRPLEMNWPDRYISDMGKTILYAENHRGNFTYNNQAQFYKADHLAWKDGAMNPVESDLRMMSSTDETHNNYMAFTAFDGSSHKINLQDASEWPSNNARISGKW